MRDECHAVTGAFGYSGQYIARRLLEKGCRVITLTNSVQRESDLHDRVAAHPFNFDRPDELVRSLEGVSVLYNTYWVRFNSKRFTHEQAVSNTRVLFAAAKRAGVTRIVHVSITNPSLTSALEYFSGKARLEAALDELGVSHAILRPTVLFGKEDILINNIAWFIRRFPLFGVFGDGQYRIQPIYVDDLAKLAVSEGESRQSAVVNAVGPETFTFKEMVRVIGEIIGRPRRIISISPRLGYWLAALVGRLTGDVIITREEIAGLMAGTLHVDTPPTGTTALTEWARENRDTLGVRYVSEMKRRNNRAVAY
jgi:NADH dehydrogenase